MAVAAYRYAEAAKDKQGRPPPPPPQINDLTYIDRFGVKAALGREVLSYREMNEMLLSENIVKYYHGRKSSDNWDQWATAYPQGHELLSLIEKVIHAD